MSAHSFRGRSVCRALVLVLVCVVPACGGGDDSIAEEAAPAEETPAAGAALDAIDPCALVTSAEATAALGADTGTGERPPEANIPPRLATCRYVAARGQGVAVLTVLTQQSDTADQARIGFQSAREQFPASTPVAGLGDDAFAVANQVSVLRGRVYLNITGDVDAGTARSLAEQALTRLP